MVSGSPTILSYEHGDLGRTPPGVNTQQWAGVRAGANKRRSGP